MARTIRLNSTDGGGEVSAGLTAADVTTQIQNEAQWILDREIVYTDTPATEHHLLFQADFANVASYHCILKGFADSSGSSYMRLHLYQGSNPLTSVSSNWTYSGWYGTNAQNGNTTFMHGIFYPGNSNSDGYQNGTNFKELRFHINDNEADTNGRRQLNLDYTAFPPHVGGYQGYTMRYLHYIEAGADWDTVKFDMNGQAFAPPSQVKLNPVIQVYKQLRAPAS